MAKAKYTKNGNVQVTMTEDQWSAIVNLLVNVRLGSTSVPENAISDLVIDLETFNDIYLDTCVVSVIKGFLTDKEKILTEDFCIVIS